jgi:hypothetical protein
MPMLRVRCERCREWIATGMRMDLETFRTSTNQTLTAQCPKCLNTQAWTLDDVDRSVFETPSKTPPRP